jgi:hypothetical protein
MRLLEILRRLAEAFRHEFGGRRGPQRTRVRNGGPNRSPDRTGRSRTPRCPDCGLFVRALCDGTEAEGCDVCPDCCPGHRPPPQPPQPETTTPQHDAQGGQS